MKVFAFLIPLFVLFSCSGSNSGGGATKTDDSGGFSAPYQFSGVIQKGPMLQGSDISVTFYDQDFSYGFRDSSAVLDDSGRFLFNDIDYRYASLSMRGYFSNELTGDISNYTTPMKAYVDLSYHDDWTVHLVSTLASERIDYLINEEGLAVYPAIQQAYQEVLRAFGMESDVDLSVANMLDDSEAARYLVAVSAISLQLAVNEAGYASGDIYELNDFISSFNTDLKVDGLIGATYGLAEKIRTAPYTLDVTTVRDNIDAIKTNLGISAATPEFKSLIDFDGDGIAFGEDDNTPDMLAVADIIDIDYETEFLTDPVVVSGLHELGYSWLIPQAYSITTYVNGVLATDEKIAVVNGDSIRFGGMSGTYGEVDNYSYQIGTESYDFSVSTVQPKTIDTSYVRSGVFSENGTLAYILGAWGLKIFDVTSAEAVEVGTYSDSVNSIDLEIRADKQVAYFSDTDDGIYALDLSNFNDITLIGRYQNSANSGTNHFILDEDSGLLLAGQQKGYWTQFDVNADGSLDNVVDNNLDSGSSNGAGYSASAGLYAIAAGSAGVYFLSSADQSLVAHYTGSDAADDVQFNHDGSMAIVLESNAFQLVDLTTPSAPQLILEEAKYLFAAEFSPNEDYLFIGSQTGLEIYSLANLPILSDAEKIYDYGRVRKIRFNGDNTEMLIVKEGSPSYIVDLDARFRN